MQGIERSAPKLEATLDPFWRSLQEAIAWCQHRLDVTAPNSSLRSNDIRPRVLEADYFAAVSSVISARDRTAVKHLLPPRGSLEGGRLLVYEPDMDLADGAAMTSSRGFFDVDNTPPWDTWVAMILDTEDQRGPYLVSWVPPPFLQLAQDGIAANPECCIGWLEDTTLRLKEHVVAECPR